MKDTKAFLEGCRTLFPSTRPHQAHSLRLDGDQIVLTLMLGDTYQEFNLNEEDLEKPVAALLVEVFHLFKKKKRGRKTPQSVPDPPSEPG